MSDLYQKYQNCTQKCLNLIEIGRNQLKIINLIDFFDELHTTSMDFDILINSFIKIRTILIGDYLKMDEFNRKLVEIHQK